MGSKPGFSIVEVVTGFALIGIVSVLVATLYFANFRLFSNQNTAIEISGQNKTALSEMVNQLRESQSVVSTCSACGTDSTSSNVVILRLWPLDAGSEPFDPGAGEYDYVVYKRDSADNTKLTKIIYADLGSTRNSQTKVIAESVSDLQFTYDNADPTLAGEVTINLTNSATINGKTQTISQSSTAILRNK